MSNQNDIKMKKYFNVFVSLMVVLLAITSCSSDDDDSPSKPATPEPRTYSEVGVWENGNYFVSLSSDHFLTAYVAPNFIDCGTYSRSNANVITSTNSYYSKNTTYTIKSIDDKSMTVEISYKDFRGEDKSKSLVLTKTDKTPTIKENPVSGKSYTWLSDVFGNETYAFNTYNTGKQSCTKGSARKYPMDFYYIYFNNCLYYQTFNPAGTQTPSIGGWNVKADTGEISVDTVTFDRNGRIYELYGVGNKL